MKLLIIILVLPVVWFFSQKWVLDVLISSILLFALIILWSRYFILLFHIKAKEKIISGLFLLCASGVVLFILLDEMNTYIKCKEALNRMATIKSCDFKSMPNTKPFRNNSYLYEEKGFGAVWSIYIEVGKDNKVIMTNPLIGFQSYNTKECFKIQI